MKRLTIIILVVLGVALTASRAVEDKTREQELQRAIDLIESKGDLAQATPLLEDVAKSTDRPLAARGLLQLAQAQERFGKTDAVSTYQRIINGFGGPAEAAATTEVVELARTRLAAMGQKNAGLTVRRVWNDVGDAVSPDGRYIAFTEWDTGDLAVHDLSSNQDRLLTTNRKWTDNFAEGGLPSPDGRLIVYSWWDNARQNSTLRVISRDGGQPRDIYPNEEKADTLWPVGWSPDGKWVLVTIDKNLPAVAGSRPARSRDIKFVSTTGTPARLVKHLDGIPGDLEMNPKMSPDGRSVIYNKLQASGKRERDLYLLAVDTGKETPLIQHAADDDVLGWMPDGERILFASDRGGSYGIWVARVTNSQVVGEPILVRSDTTDVDSLGITRQGDFYYGLRTRDSDVYVANLDAAASTASSRPTRLPSRFVGGKLGAAWSPDGARIAYTKETTASDSTPTLAVQDVSTGVTQSFPLPLDNVYYPVWMPDGHAIVVQGRDKQLRQGLHRVDLETGVLTSIAVRDPANNINRGSAAPSPDGRQLFYGWSDANDTTKGGVMVRDMASGVERQLTTTSITRLALSPDGRWLAVTRANVVAGKSIDGPKLIILPAAGGPPMNRVAGLDTWRMGDIAWNPDGRSILVVKAGSSAAEIWQVPIDGGEPRRVGIDWLSINRISVHPDGRRLAVSTSGSSSETWVLQNLPVMRDK